MWGASERSTVVELGFVVATPGALRALEAAGQSADEFLARHMSGDWGELGQADCDENELSLREGFRIFSAYVLRTGVKILIITEADRSVTTVFLPEEY